MLLCNALCTSSLSDRGEPPVFWLLLGLLWWLTWQVSKFSWLNVRSTNQELPWAKNDCTIYSGNEFSRIARALHYIINKVRIGDEYREHLFVVVGWLTEHQCRMLYGKLWNHTKYIQDGPATFLPVHKITCRFAAGYGQVDMPHGKSCLYVQFQTSDIFNRFVKYIYSYS